MTASHPRRKAVPAILAIAFISVLSACTNTTNSSGPSSTSPSGSQTSAQCAAGASCTTAAITSGNTTLTVATGASTSAQTLTAQLSNGQLHCPTVPFSQGALATFDSTATDVSKTVTYVMSGAAAQAQIAAFRAHPSYVACFASPHPFTGYAGPHNNRSVFVPADQLYEAQLFTCGTHDVQPCVKYSADGGNVTLTILAPPGDPRVLGSP